MLCDLPYCSHAACDDERTNSEGGRKKRKNLIGRGEERLKRALDYILENWLSSTCTPLARLLWMEQFISRVIHSKLMQLVPKWNAINNNFPFYNTSYWLLCLTTKLLLLWMKKLSWIAFNVGAGGVWEGSIEWMWKELINECVFIVNQKKNEGNNRRINSSLIYEQPFIASHKFIHEKWEPNVENSSSFLLSLHCCDFLAAKWRIPFLHFHSAPLSDFPSFLKKDFSEMLQQRDLQWVGVKNVYKYFHLFFKYSGKDKKASLCLQGRTLFV